MCGIIAVVGRPSNRAAPAPALLLEKLGVAEDLISEAVEAGTISVENLMPCAAHLEFVDRELRGAPGVGALLRCSGLLDEIESRSTRIHKGIDTLDQVLDSSAASLSTGELEAVTAALIRVKDAAWAIARDRVRNAQAVGDLAGGGANDGMIDAFVAVQVALSALDRLEVRGRDSAGLHLLVRDHGLDLDDASIRAMLAERGGDAQFRSRAVCTPGGLLSFVYKAAAEIGELGDNTASLREAIKADELLRQALSSGAARATVLGHTRWASVGVTSEANAHPLNSEEVGRPEGPYVLGVLNGDVDNYGDLIALEGLAIAPEITTDAKVIPALVSRRIADGEALQEALRATAVQLEGSVAVAISAVAAPDQLLLALRGSGQAMYIGLAEDCFVVASEPYGLVEETTSYVRMDGETPSNLENVSASRGQIVVLDAAGAGTIEGITRLSYDGTLLPVTEDDIQVAQITTRDIDRAEFPHFLLKEITEAPNSFRKTLRGKIVTIDGHLHVDLDEAVLSRAIREGLHSGAIRRVLVIGQGTAAVAGQSLASALEVLAPGLIVQALAATELSGFGMGDTMEDTLIIAISQSGTTTDTNRTVDLVRGRGALVIAIVNRRNSDLTDKADGVLYTSDGRDVEMSVASTKAFYAQVAAGFLLASAIAEIVNGDTGLHTRDELLRSLLELPDVMRVVLARRSSVAEAARRVAPHRRYWAVVGNGPNKVAAQEVRIKLSELCYKSIACDVTEDKKHIDLSSEPLIFVCAAGLSGSNADDVAKEVAIYRAHKAAPVVVASDGEDRFSAALEMLTVPAVHPMLAFVLSAMVGHLFGYEAALAIDASALPMREARAAIEGALGSTTDSDAAVRALATVLVQPTERIFEGLRANIYDGHLEASTAVKLASLLRYAIGVAPLESYQIEYGVVGTPGVIIDALTSALTRGIEELTRPVDAIKHQAKTVTVGISRSDETLLRVRLVSEVLSAGAERDNLSYRALRTLVDLDPAVERVSGYTRYLVDGDVATDAATIRVVDRGGESVSLVSRTDRDPRLRGTKRRAATEREVTVSRGHDGRTVLIIPEVKAAQTVGITLLHLDLRERLEPSVARSVLQGYRSRYAAIRDAVTENEPTFDDNVLGTIDLAALLTEPVVVLAQHWRST